MKKNETYEAYDYTKLVQEQALLMHQMMKADFRKKQMKKGSVKQKSNAGKVVATVAVGTGYAGARTIWKLMKRYM